MNLRRFLCVELPLAAIGYALLTAIITWPVAKHLGSTVLGPVDSDSAAVIWWLDATQAPGYRVTGSTVFPQIAVPFGVEQANGLNLQWLLPYLPAYFATKVVGAVLAYNLTVLTGFVLSGCAMYALIRRLGASVAVAAWAGAGYLMFPWHVERAVAGHASLVHIACFPLVALSLLHLFERRTIARLLLVGLAVVACWLSSGYYGVMALVTVPIAAVAAALVTLPRRRSLMTAALVAGVTIVASGIVGVASTAGGGDGGIGATRELDDLSIYGVRPLELVVPSPGSTLLRRIAPTFLESRRHGSNIQEVSNYLGWVAILLAGCWIVIAFRRRATLSRSQRAATAAIATSGFVALAFSLPNPIGIMGRLFPYMPSRILWEVVPAFRVPSRWTVILCFAMLVLASLGLEAVVARFGWKSAGRRHAAALGVVALAFTCMFVEYRVTHPGVYYSATVAPSEYALLARTPAGALAEYPFVARENSTTSSYLLWQRAHGRPLLNGASTNSESEDLRRALVDPTAPGQAARLAALGATAVITRPTTFSRSLEEGIPEVAPRLGAGYTLVGERGGASVWAIAADPAPAFAYLASPDFSVPMRVRGLVTQDLEGADGTIIVRSATPFRGTLRLQARTSRPTRLTIGDTVVIVASGRTNITAPIDIPTGRSTVRVHVAGVDEGEIGLSLSAPVISR